MYHIARSIYTIIIMLNPLPDENSWEYIFYDRILDDDMVNFLLKMKRGEALCNKCHSLYNVMRCEGRCPKCGSRDKTILSGQSFIVKEIGVIE